MSELWDKYHERFGAWFPTMCFPNDTPEELDTKIQLCLERNQRAEEVFNLSYEGDLYY